MRFLLYQLVDELRALKDVNNVLPAPYEDVLLEATLRAPKLSFLSDVVV